MSDIDQNPEESQESNVNVGDTVRATWNVSLDDLRNNISHCSEQAQDLLVWCFLWCIDPKHPLRRQEFALRAGIDDSTVFRLIRGKYTDGEGRRIPITENMIRRLESFKELEQERTQQKRTKFVLTPTAKRIFTACDLARESQTPVFLRGPSHVGKTWALEEYTRQNNHGHTVYVRLTASDGLGGMVRLIAKSLGISDKANTADLKERIKRALKPNMLLILDEVHELLYTYRKESFFACLEVIREFYDAAGCGMVLCSTDLLFKRVQDNRGELEQVLRRGVHKVVLPTAPLAADIATIAETIYGLKMPDKKEKLTVIYNEESFVEEPYKMLKELGEQDGLKAITERLRYGSKLAIKAKVKTTWAHVVRAHLTIKANATIITDWE